MKTCNKCKDNLPLINFGVKSRNKDGLNPICSVCKNKLDKEYRSTHKESCAASGKKYRYSNIDRVKEKAYRDANKELVTARTKAWQLLNKSKVAATGKRWQQENKARGCAKTARYNSRKINATPSWANLKRIECYYSVAAMLNREGLDKWHVDHMVPLQGKKVCGLHVENNLQILTASDNCKKSNSHHV